MVRGQALKIMVDNAGSCAIWRKGYSTSCALLSVLVRALYEVSVALECKVDILKVSRCSDSGSQMADALSKAGFVNFWELASGSGHTMRELIGSLPKPLIDQIILVIIQVLVVG